MSDIAIYVLAAACIFVPAILFVYLTNKKPEQPKKLKLATGIKSYELEGDIEFVHVQVYRNSFRGDYELATIAFRDGVAQGIAVSDDCFLNVDEEQRVQDFATEVLPKIRD